MTYNRRQYIIDTAKMMESHGCTVEQIINYLYAEREDELLTHYKQCFQDWKDNYIQYRRCKRGNALLIAWLVFVFGVLGFDLYCLWRALQ